MKQSTSGNFLPPHTRGCVNTGDSGIVFCGSVWCHVTCDPALSRVTCHDSRPSILGLTPLLTLSYSVSPQHTLHWKCNFEENIRSVQFHDPQMFCHCSWFQPSSGEGLSAASCLHCKVSPLYRCLSIFVSAYCADYLSNESMKPRRRKRQKTDTL